MSRIARKEAAKMLVDRYDTTVRILQASRPENLQDGNSVMSVSMTYNDWQSIVETLRPLAED